MTMTDELLHVAAPYLPLWHPQMTPLVGRNQESTLVMAHYEAVKQGFAHVVLVSGEPGVGKTRFLHAIAKQIFHKHALVFLGHTSEAEGMPPYLPFLEVLGHAVRTLPPDQLRQLLTPTTQALVHLVPELSAHFTDHFASPPFPMEQSRLRLYEAVRTFLEAISRIRPLVLLFDDLHWADSASLDLLCYLMSHRTSAHLLLLGAYREGEVNQNTLLEHALTELNHQRVSTTVTLPPLTMSEISELAHNLLGDTPDSDICARLYTQSEGNPFFAEELLRSWIEEGLLTHQQHLWQPVTLLEAALPPSIIGALRQRFTRLPTEYIDDLRVAAIMGRTFDPSLLAALQQQAVETIEDRLLVMAHAHLVYSNQDGRFTFSHDKIRECLAAEVSTTRRRRLHGMIGRILEEQLVGNEQTTTSYQLADLAFHFAHSDDGERGILYSLRAASQAVQTNAFEEALVHYQAAIALLKPDDARHGELLLAQGEVALLVGKDAEAENAYLKAQRWFTSDEHREALARATHGLGRVQWRQQKQAEAHTTLKCALAVLDERHCAERVKVLADLSVLLTATWEQQEEGQAYAQEARVIAQELGDATLEILTRRISIGNFSVLQGNDLAATIPPLEEDFIQAELHHNLTEAAACCLALMTACYWAAAISHAHQVNTHRIALVEHAQQQHHLHTAYSWQALLFAVQGFWADADRMISLAHPIVHTLTSPLPLAFIHQVCGFLAYQREHYIIAEEELLMAQENRDRQRGLDESMFSPGLLGLVQATMGKTGEARASIQQMESILTVLPTGTLSTVPLMMCLALTAMMLGDHEQDQDLYRALLPFRGQHYWFLVDRVLGMLALHTQQWEAAHAHLAEAEATARREGLQPELARTLWEQAILEAAYNGQERGLQRQSVLKQAHILFEALGMSDSASRAGQCIYTPSQQSHSTPCTPLPSHLTRREVEILQFVVQGKSNCQIAKALGLSEKTVTNHLTHIFNKTTSDNRAAATAFAIHHGLA